MKATENSISEEVKDLIKLCVENYKEDEDFQDNLGDTLHEFLSSNGTHAEDEVEFEIWENYAWSLI